MFIWTAVSADDQLQPIKTQAQDIEKELGFEHSALTLPSHISLKISFCVDEEAYPNVIQTLLDYCKTVKPFCVDVDGFELENTIVWIRIKENAILKTIHNDLDRILSEQYSIAPHPFDLDFKFHSTLFLDRDKEKINTAYHRIKNAKIPALLNISQWIIGASQSGAIGTYRVTHTVDLGKN